MNACFGNTKKIIIIVILLQVIANFTNGDHDAEYFTNAMLSRSFVDKTLLLKELFAEPSKYVLITCPRQFGKTVNLDMARSFFQMAINKREGIPIERNATENYRLFTNELFEMKITGDKFFNEHFGKYPIIYICFAKTGDNSEEIREQMIKTLTRVFQSYEWLVAKLKEKKYAQNASYDNDWNLFQKIILEKPTADDITNGLYLLVKHISEYFSMQIIVLIDNYDFPITRALAISKHIERVVEFVNSLLHSLTEAHDYVKFALISGISRIHRAGHSCKPYIRHYRCFDDHKFSEYYGILENELDMLLRKHHIEEEKHKVKEFYKGYEILNRNSSLYNPKDIRDYFYTNRIDKHWVNTERRTLLYDFLNRDAMMQATLSLLSTKTVYFELMTNVSLNELLIFAEMRSLVKNRRFRITKHHVNLHLTDLFEQGYFSFTKHKNIFRIPNLEIENEFRQELRNFFWNSFQVDISNMIVINRLRPIVEYEHTTAEMLSNLTDALNDVFTPEVKRRIDSEFHFKTLIFALTFCTITSIHRDIYAERMEKHTERVVKGIGPGEIDILLVSENQENMLIIEIELGGDTSHVADVVDRCTKYVPQDSPQSRKIRTVKYLAINMNAIEEIKVAAGKNLYLK